MRRRITATVAAVVAAAAVAYPVLDAVDVAPGVLTSDWSVGGSVPQVVSVQAAHVADADATGLEGGRGSELVLDPAAPVPDPTRLAERLRPVLAAPALGPRAGAMVLDAATGAALLTVHPDVPRTPASTAKVLTAAAVAADSDLAVTRRTRVVAGAQPKSLVLVADGDTLLARGAGAAYRTAGRAGLADLAAATAKALAADGGSGPYTLALDDRVAAGPQLAPAWERVDVAAGLTGPVTMLGLADDRALPGRPASADPAMTAAVAFRDALQEAGVDVAEAVTRVPGRGAPRHGRQLAEVRSAPLADVLTLALAESDNALTEVVARRAFADRGVPATFEAAGAHVVSTLAGLGVSTEGLRLLDTSGLTRGSRATVRTITETTALALGDRLPGFTRVVAGLPVAGLTGTLFDRFEAPAALPGRGLVRGKSGTLTGVGGLTGTLVDTSGRLLVYTVLADSAPPGATLATRAALDAVTTAIVTCECSATGASGLRGAWPTAGLAGGDVAG